MIRALFTPFVATVQKIITYALGAHDPGPAQEGRTSNDFCTPVQGTNGPTFSQFGQGRGLPPHPPTQSDRIGQAFSEDFPKMHWKIIVFFWRGPND